MKSTKNSALGKILTDRRKLLGLSGNEVAKRAALKGPTYWRIETGEADSPHIENVLAIAKALDMSRTDMFISLGWLPPDELPSLLPYLQTKYCELPPEAFEKIEGYFSDLTEHYGVSFDIDRHQPPQRERNS